MDEAVTVAQSIYNPLKANFGVGNRHAHVRLHKATYGATTVLALDQSLPGPTTFHLGGDDENYVLEIPMFGATNAETRGGDCEIKAGQKGFIVSPSQSSKFRDNGARYQAMGVILDKAALDRRFQILTGRHVTSELVFSPEIDLESQDGRKLTDIVALLAQFIDGTELTLPSSTNVDLYQEFLVNVLLTTLPHSESTVLFSRPPNVSDQVLRKSEEFMRAYSDTPLTIGEIAAKAGVNVRTLQRAFKEARGITPMQQLKAFRLAKAHQRLVSAGPHSNVTQIAMTSGFSHLGNFSAAYRRRYGEFPSATMARAKEGRT